MFRNVYWSDFKQAWNFVDRFSTNTQKLLEYQCHENQSSGAELVHVDRRMWRS
jgi:hypothetical protein